MKIAILTSGILPVPAVQGGAVENLIDFYLEYNDRHHLHDITVYSVGHPEVYSHPALQSRTNHYYYVDTTCWLAKVQRTVRRWRKPKNDYYNNHIEYFFEQAYKEMRRRQYDCIILENRPGYAKKLTERGHDNIVLHLHNDLLNNSTPHHQQIFNSLQRILTVSDYIKRRVATISPSDKIVTVYNGINTERFSPKISNSVRRADFGFDANDFILVYSGRINKDKGIAELIDAMILLHDMPHIKLMIIGSSFFGNATNEDDFVRYLKRKAEIIEQQIVFTGFVDYNRMPDYLSISDIAIVPSIWDDPFPTTVLEAQAMGLPIICTKRGGIPEEVTPKNALLIDTDKDFVENLAKAILELYNNPQKRNEMSMTAIENSKFYHCQRFAKDFLMALEK